MANKLKTRVNKYFGEGTWANLDELHVAHFTELGAHRVWRLAKGKKLEMPEPAPKPKEKADTVPLVLAADPVVTAEGKGLLKRLFGR